MKWTQGSISHWATRTFGWSSPKTIAVRLNKEMAELLSALEHGEKDEAIKECADIYIMVSQIAEGLLVDLDDEVQKKMDINEKRQWKKGKDGSYQHV